MDFVVALKGIVILLIYIALYIQRKFRYWKNLGVTQFETKFPYGSIKGVGSKFHISKFLVDHYNKTKALHQKMSGFYMFTRPILMLTDLEVIKAIMVKDFNIFPNRGLYFNEKDDPISAHMFNVENEQWRTLRQKLSPTFTSGKLKMMFSTIDDVSVKLMEVLNDEVESGVVEIKDILARFTTDVIGSAAFGLDCNSLEDKNSKFYEMGTRIFSLPSSVLKRTLRNANRNLARILKIKLLPDDVADFYMSITKKTVSYRESNPNIKRHDFMNLLVEMKKENIVTVEQIAAQSFVFFLAGFETSSSTMTYCMYELAMNEDIQEKARESVLKVLDRHDNEFTYESVGEMNYLEQCVNETLRKYPVISSLQRAPISDYEIPSTGVKIEKGQSVWIPVYAIHYDEEIYPKPETFNPDRFTQEEISKRHPMAFLPFGEGPRICIGMRFGMLETKLGLAKILANYKFSIDTTRTQVPLRLSAKSVVLTPEEKIYLKMTKRV